METSNSTQLLAGCFNTIQGQYNVPVNNRFQTLQSQQPQPGTSRTNTVLPTPENNKPDDGDEQAPTRPAATKAKTPPPIVFHTTVKDHKKIIEELKKDVKSGFHLKYGRTNTNLFIHDKNEYENYLLKLAQTEDHEYHTYTSKEERHHAFVLGGLPEDVSTDEIKADIEDNFKVNVMNVFKMKNTKRPLFLVIMDHTITIKFLQNSIRYVYNTKIDWQKHYNNKLLIQCHRCQQWAHATTNCRAAPKCLKCAEGHWTKDCKNFPIRLEENLSKLKCANCGENHPANSIKCKEYLQKVDYIHSRRQTYTNRTTVAPKYVPAPTPTSNAWARGNPISKTPNQTAQQYPTTSENNTQNQPTHNNDSFNGLVSEMDELSKLINLDKMFNAVKQLNQLLKSCNSELEKFKVFYSFCQANFK